MLTKLAKIAELAKAKPKEQFTSLAHLINEELLEFCLETSRYLVVVLSYVRFQ